MTKHEASRRLKFVAGADGVGKGGPGSAGQAGGGPLLLAGGTWSRSHPQVPSSQGKCRLELMVLSEMLLKAIGCPLRAR